MSSNLINQENQREQWSSEPAFIFSMAAAAVGLGNLWRFPYMVGENGGGAFIIAYLASLIVIGLPIMMLEVGAGRLAEGSVVKTFRQAHKWANLFGWFVVLLTVLITSYYLVITGWTLGYALSSLRFSTPYFDDFTANYNSVWYFLLTLALATIILIKGVSAIEKLSKFLMPILITVIIGLIIVATQMDGWSQASSFILQTDFTRLKDPKLWFFAVGQSFYTLAIGQGYLMTYGSFIPRKTHVPRACLIVTITETSIALMAGWMIFPFVFTLGLEPDTGSALAFDTLPRVFEEISGGAYLSIAFFCLFFAAAFSSCLAGLKVIISAIDEELKIGHFYSVLATAVIMVFLGMPSALSFSSMNLTIQGQPFLDFLDQLAGTNIVILSGVFGAGIFCWLIPRARIAYSLGAKSKFWKWRILIIGRSLPFITIFYFIWNFYS